MLEHGARRAARRQFRPPGAHPLDQPGQAPFGAAAQHDPRRCRGPTDPAPSIIAASSAVRAATARSASGSPHQAYTPHTAPGAPR